MRFGYARVSTPSQDLKLQLDALAAFGCDDVIQEIASGATTDRPARARLLDKLRRGDVLVVWRLDRLGRSVQDLLATVAHLDAAGVELVSLQEQIDTATATGRLVFHLFSAMAEFERELIRERTQAGLSASRAKGRIGGRPKALSERKLRAAKLLIKEGDTVEEAARAVGVSRSTLYRAIKALDADISS